MAGPGLKGRCAEIYGSEVREYQPLTVQFLPPNETHSLEISSLEVRAFSVEVAPQWLDRTREYPLLLDHSVHAPGGLIPIEWREDDEVVLTGRADLVYSGEWLG